MTQIVDWHHFFHSKKGSLLDQNLNILIRNDHISYSYIKKSSKPILSSVVTYVINIILSSLVRLDLFEKDVMRSISRDSIRQQERQRNQ